MGWMTGLEPATTGSTIRGSNQLSYTHRRRGMVRPARAGVNAITGAASWGLTLPSARKIVFGD